MGTTDRYLKDVMGRIQVPPAEKRRIESDLNVHLQDLREELGDDVSLDQIRERMGDPMEVADGFMDGIILHYAGYGARAMAFLVDMAACFAVSAVLALPALVLAGSRMPEITGVGLIFKLFAFSLILAAAGLMILYFPILEGRFGTTLGKQLLNLHVVRESGGPIGYKEAFLRRIPYYFEFLFIDMLFIFFTAKRQRAFDLISRTVVIRNV